MRSRRVTFENRSGLTLTGTLDLPAGEAAAFAIYAHCFTCGRNLKIGANIARALAGRGIGVLRFDFAGVGDSEGDFARTSLTTNRDDLLAAADFLAAAAGPARLLVGHSLGGAAALLAARELAACAAVAVIAAPSEPAHLSGLLAAERDEARAAGEAELALGGRTFRLRPEFFADLEATRLREAVRELGRPLLILHAPRDETVGVEHATALFQAARHPKSFVSLGDADHLLLDERDARWAGEVIAAWAGRYL